MNTIHIKLLSDKVSIPTQIKVGDWIDLSTSENVYLNQFEEKYIPLGVCMKLPRGFEAILAPRSSTYRKYGVIQSNSIGVFDESYCGNEDEWKFPALALRETFIPAGTRICQFRVFRHMEDVEFVQVYNMTDESRGGFGSTGTTLYDLKKEMLESM